MSLIPLWTSEELRVVLTKNSEKTGAHWNCYGVSIDSRSLKKNDLFFALSGDNFDGHKYAASALEKGAAGIVVSKFQENIDPARQIIVPDVHAALIALGLAGRSRVNIPIIAVTGSVGKTGTKEVLKSCLSRHKKTHASVLSYNNDLGVPLSLARMPSDTGYGVFELGMNHAGELRELVKMVRPHVAIITTVAPAHSEFFPSVKDIANAKAEIFEGLEEGGIAILNHDNEFFDHLAAKATELGVKNIVSFGSPSEADIHILRHITHETCSCVVADIMGKIMTFKIGMLGHHWVMNSLAVLGAVELAGADLGLAGLELAEMQPLKGRGRRHQIMIDPMMDASFLLIDESYNANPASMAAAIATLGEVDVSRGAVKIAVLGDMGELGDLAKNFHLDLGGLLEKSGISRLYAVGEYMSLLAETLPASITGKIFKNSIDLVASLKYEIRTGDVVMVKGSNASGMNFVVDKMLEIDHNALLENSRSA
jgi:UDP-N-acetylmuramoyl-tripeptide--D-alanyl-D-alanine ligase